MKMTRRRKALLALICQVAGLALTIGAAWCISGYMVLVVIGFVLYHEAEQVGK